MASPGTPLGSGMEAGQRLDGREVADRSSEPLQAVTVALQSETIMAAPSPRFGFVGFAETWNGRLAMLGFVIGLGTELLTGQGILAQIGLS